MQVFFSVYHCSLKAKLAVSTQSSNVVLTSEEIRRVVRSLKLLRAFQWDKGYCAMMLNFSPNEFRLLGCLVEKQLATPDYYPMTENSLVLAANQKSSRDPVLSLSVEEVAEALAELSKKEFVEQVKESGSRAFKFRQRLDLRWKMSDLGAEADRDVLAVLAVLALRGPQTVGQIRQRTERMFFFPGLDHVQGILTTLMSETSDRPALVKEDLTVPGREKRYVHTLGEHPISGSVVVVKRESSFSAGEEEALVDRVVQLEERLSILEEKMRG